MKLKIYTYIIFTSIPFLFIFGCGHNVMSYQKGQAVNVGYDPSTNKAGIQWLNGESIVVVNRENTYFEADLNQTTDAAVPGSSGGAEANSGNISKIKYSTGIQINGYTTDLAKENPELASQILTQMAKNGVQVRYFKIDGSKMTEISKEAYDSSDENVVKMDGRNLSVKTTKDAKTSTTNTSKTGTSTTDETNTSKLKSLVKSATALLTTSSSSSSTADSNIATDLTASQTQTVADCGIATDTNSVESTSTASTTLSKIKSYAIDILGIVVIVIVILGVVLKFLLTDSTSTTKTNDTKVDDSTVKVDDTKVDDSTVKVDDTKVDDTKVDDTKVDDSTTTTK
jgi:hypothetical protein